jgi:ubiquinone biosynthesis protein UbiJ
MLTERFQAAVERALAESALARELCARLMDRSLCIVVRHTPLVVTLHSDGRTLHIAAAGAAPPGADATISGSALGLLGMARPDRRELVLRGVVDISGDTEVAERFARLLALLRPDVETVLGDLLGRAPGHVLAAAAQQALRGGRELLNSLSATTADYFAHERRELLTGAEAENFYRQVRELQMRVAALEARARARAAGRRGESAR